MKKLVQIAIVLILICVLFQPVSDGSIASVSKAGSGVVGGTLITEETPAADVHATGCLVRIKGVICVMPNVGWNT